jgi:hypothetical protein
MCLPFPLELASDLHSSPRLKALGGHYASLWNRVLDFRDRLRENLEPAKAQNVAVFSPKVKEANVFIPPFAGRYALVVGLLPNGIYAKTLYIWMETEGNSALWKLER